MGFKRYKSLGCQNFQNASARIRAMGAVVPICITRPQRNCLFSFLAFMPFDECRQGFKFISSKWNSAFRLVHTVYANEGGLSARRSQEKLEFAPVLFSALAMALHELFSPFKRFSSKKHLDIGWRDSFLFHWITASSYKSPFLLLYLPITTHAPSPTIKRSLPPWFLPLGNAWCPVIHILVHQIRSVVIQQRAPAP